MKSIGQKILSLEGLLGTPDVNDWEAGFIESISERTDHGAHTAGLTAKQIEIIDRIHDKHFV